MMLDRDNNSVPLLSWPLAALTLCVQNLFRSNKLTPCAGLNVTQIECKIASNRIEVVLPTRLGCEIIPFKVDVEDGQLIVMPETFYPKGHIPSVMNKVLGWLGEAAKNSPFEWANNSLSIPLVYFKCGDGAAKVRLCDGKIEVL